MSIQSNRPLIPSTGVDSTPPVSSPSGPPSQVQKTPVQTSAPPPSLSKDAPPLDPQQHQAQIQQQIETMQTPQLQQTAKSVPLPGRLKPTAALPLNPDQAKAQFGVLLSQTSDVEKSLRSTFFKTRGQRQKLLNQAMDSVKQKMSQLDDLEGLKFYLKSARPQDVKSILAQQVGAMRSEIYGSNASYTSLSANKKALVDSLYKAMMSQTVDSHGALQVPEQTDKTVRQPGREGVLTQDLTLGDKTYKKGQTVIYHKKDGKHFVQLHLAKPGAKPDALDAMEIKHTRYEVGRDQVKLSHKPDIPVHAPLFEGPVSVSDIRQGSIGDCYLIAGIYSIAQKNPQAIHEMMKDNGDGTVTVRLYDKNKDTQQLEPIYITVDKSVPNDDAHAKDTLWVQMLEKAYAVHNGSYTAIGKGGRSHEVFTAFLGVQSKSENMPPGGKSLKSVLNGIPDFAMTGFAMEKIKANQEALGLTDEQLQSLENLNASGLEFLFTGSVKVLEEQTGLAWPQLSEPLEEYKNSLKSEDPQVKQAAREKLMVFKSDCRQKQELLNSLLKNENRKALISQMLETSPTYQQLKQRNVVFEEDIQQIVTEVSDYVQQNSRLSHGGQTFASQELLQDFQKVCQDSAFPKRDQMTATGFVVDYTQQQNDFFQKVQQDLKAGKYIAVGSKEVIGISQGKGHSGGESQVDGLAGQHAYALLDTVEMNGHKFVRIANPWGDDFSRDYTLKEGQLVPKTFDKDDYSYQPKGITPGGIGVNESWVELRELSTLFNSYYVTE
ncbi:MAG: hypothetical protein IGS03_03570 [Candidatus Sericytochromatia bacterium]|nr:hypothetical protein [Candidatus Sericytochromatia bacterium]